MINENTNMFTMISALHKVYISNYHLVPHKYLQFYASVKNKRKQKFLDLLIKNLYLETFSNAKIVKELEISIREMVP